MRIKFFIIALLIVLLAPLAANAQDFVDCFHDDKAEPQSIAPAEDCAVVNGAEVLRFTPEILENTRFTYRGQDGSSCIYLAQGLGAYLVLENGRFARVPYWGNQCAWFIEGLSVTQLAGRQAYIDKDLNVVLDPGFEFLSEFSEHGYAKVCNGPFVFVERGEQRRRTGGKCGLINRAGELVTELDYPYEDSAAMMDEFRNAQSEQEDLDHSTNQERL